MLKVNTKIPLHNAKVSDGLTLLSKNSKYMVSNNTLNRHIKNVVDYKTMSLRGDEGIRCGRHPIVYASSIVIINDRVFFI